MVDWNGGMCSTGRKVTVHAVFHKSKECNHGPEGSWNNMDSPKPDARPPEYTPTPDARPPEYAQT